MEVFVFDVFSAGVDDAERAAEIPDGQADPMARENLQNIAQPGENDLVGHLVVRSTFAAMDSDSHPSQVGPLLVVLLEALSVPAVHGPSGIGKIFAIDPGSSVVFKSLSWDKKGDRVN